MSVCRILHLWSVSRLNLVNRATKLRHWIRPSHKTRDTCDSLRTLFPLITITRLCITTGRQLNFGWRHFRLRAPVKRPDQIVIGPIEYNTYESVNYLNIILFHMIRSCINKTILHCVHFPSIPHKIFKKLD